MTRLNDFVSRYRRQLAVTVGGTLALGILAHAVAQPVQQPIFRSLEGVAQTSHNISAAQAGPILAAKNADGTLAEARKVVSNIDLDLEEGDVASRKAELHKSAIDLEYEAALARESAAYANDLVTVEKTYHDELAAVEARYAKSLADIERSYHSVVQKAETEYASASAGEMSDPARKVLDLAYTNGRDAASKVYTESWSAAGVRYNQELAATNQSYNLALEAANVAHNNAYGSIQEAYGSVVYRDLQVQTADDLWAQFATPVAKR